MEGRRAEEGLHLLTARMGVVLLVWLRAPLLFVDVHCCEWVAS